MARKSKRSDRLESQNAAKTLLANIRFMSVDDPIRSIVITSSVTGDMVADPGEVAYATTKAALVGFTKALAREMAPHNIRVNCICPGYVQTPLVEGMASQSDPDDPTRAISAIAHAVPLGRLGTPDECGELCAFLASNEASYITGTQMVIDGGSTLPETTSMGQ